MTNEDLQAIGKDLAAATREFISGIVGEWKGRLQSLEDRTAAIKDGAPGQKGDPGDRGTDGEKGERGDVGTKGDPGERGEAGTPGERGLDGASGVKGDPGDTGAAGEKGDPGPSGEKGDPGAPGEPGTAGANGADGAKGDKGDPGEPGPIGAAGPAGADGVDGKSVTVDDFRPLFDAELARALLDLERRNADAIARLPKAADGAAGLNGKDALGFDDIQVEHDGERGFTFKFVRGDQVKTFGTFIVPATIHRGVYVEGKTYDKGDGVTWAGSFWIANASTAAKPGMPTAESRAWVLAVKKGSDGRQGPQGPAGEPPRPVKLP